MSPPGDPLPENSFSHLIHRLHHALRESFEQRLSSHQISVSERKVLVYCSQGVETPAGLADSLGIDRSAVTRLVDQLGRKGLLSREPNLIDRRSTVVRLTDTGRALVPLLIEYAEAIEQEFLGHLGKRERTELQRLLREVVGRIRRRNYDAECPEE